MSQTTPQKIEREEEINLVDYIKETVSDGLRWEVDITYLLQEPLGFIPAVKKLKSFWAILLSNLSLASKPEQ